MMEKDPLAYPLLTYAWVFGLALLGGLAGYARKVKSGLVDRFSLIELLGEMVISAFVGIITFYLCEAARVAPVLAAAFIGVAGHMGSRAVFVMESGMARVISRLVNKP